MSRRRPKKQPGSVVQPHVRKSPRSITVPDTMRQRPSWRLSLMELVDPFGWHRLDAEGLHRVRHKLCDFESMTWGEILVRANTQHHFVEVGSLAKAARDRLEEIGQGDVDQLVSLRLSGRERIWGVLDGPVLELLWWDPRHRVCPSMKKHT